MGNILSAIVFMMLVCALVISASMLFAGLRFYGLPQMLSIAIIAVIAIMATVLHRRRK